MDQNNIYVSVYILPPADDFLLLSNVPFNLTVYSKNPKEMLMLTVYYKSDLMLCYSCYRWPGRRGTRPQLTTWVCSKLVWPNCGGNSSHQKEALVQQQEKVRCLFLKTYSLLISRYNYKPVILFYPLQSLVVDSVDTSFECFFFSFRF